jgi:hypothetical protein
METALWLTVIASGVYHGVNPGMGWPLAVSAGLMGKGRRDLIASLGPLGAGHFLAMAAILAPFAVMTALVAWQREIRIGAGLVVIAAGAHLLVARRHPRFLARIKPTQLALWSFAVATAHGAGLMLLPIYLGICAAGEQDAGHQAAGRKRENQSRRHPHEIQLIADEALAAFVTPITPTRIRLSAQTTSRLNQLLEMNVNPSHSCTAKATIPPLKIIAVAWTIETAIAVPRFPRMSAAAAWWPASCSPAAQIPR